MSRSIAVMKSTHSSKKTIRTRGQPLTKFTLFTNLPEELRHDIFALATTKNTLHITTKSKSVLCSQRQEWAWSESLHSRLFFTCQDGHLESVTATPLLGVCHESKDEILKRYTVKHPGRNGLIPLDPTRTSIHFKLFQIDEALRYKLCNGDAPSFFSNLRHVSIDMTFFTTYEYKFLVNGVDYGYMKSLLGSFSNLEKLTLVTAQAGSVATAYIDAKDLPSGKDMKADLVKAKTQLMRINEGMGTLKLRFREKREALDPKTRRIYTKVKMVVLVEV